MAKTAHGGFTPPKGNPSGNGRDQQGVEDLAGVSPETDEQMEKVADNRHLQHPNRNVNKGEDTNKPNQQLDL